MYKNYLMLLINTLQELDISQIEEAEGVILKCWKEGGRVYIMGNESSSVAAYHWAYDFSKLTDESQKIFASGSFENEVSMNKSSNDITYKAVLEEQLAGVLKPEDLLIGISVCGNSKDIIKAFENAKALGAKTLAIVGSTGGELKELSDYYIYIPSYNYGIVEDVQLSIDHMIGQEIKSKLMEEQP